MYALAQNVRRERVIRLKALSVVMLTILLVSIAVPTAYADTTRAECGFSASDTARPAETSACSFSQRQGFIHITIDGGPEFDFQPVGDAPGNYVDANGRAVYRRSALGEQGQLFRLNDQYLYVYWQQESWACTGEQLAGSNGCELVYGSIAFRLSATAAGSLNELTVQVSGLKGSDQQEQQQIDGTAYRAEVADLDANGWPEVYIYISSAGSGSYGSLLAYAVNNGKSVTPIYLPELTSDPVASQGYMGHDEFAVVENRLVRRFPVYRQGDSNSRATGGMRQLQYRLEPGEAAWVLRVDKVVEY